MVPSGKPQVVAREPGLVVKDNADNMHKMQVVAGAEIAVVQVGMEQDSMTVARKE